MEHVTDNAPVELEMERLQAILSTTFENAHYNPNCRCDSCVDTRAFLSPEDLAFVHRTFRLIEAADTEVRVS